MSVTVTVTIFSTGRAATFEILSSKTLSPQITVSRGSFIKKRVPIGSGRAPRCAPVGSGRAPRRACYHSMMRAARGCHRAMRHCASRQRLGASSAFTWDPRTRLDISPASGSCFLINRASRRLKSFSQELCRGNGWDLPAPHDADPGCLAHVGLPARGSKCSGHLAAVKGCPFGHNSRPESAGPGRDVRPLPHSLCGVWRRVSSSRYLGIAPVNVPPTLALPRHVDMCRRRFRRSGSLAVDLRTPASPLSGRDAPGERPAASRARHGG